jgi:hypothetical protein
MNHINAEYSAIIVKVGAIYAIVLGRFMEVKDHLHHYEDFSPYLRIGGCLGPESFAGCGSEEKPHNSVAENRRSAVQALISNGHI